MSGSSSNRPSNSTGETDLSRRRRMAKARADAAKARANERRERFAIRKDESGKRVLNENYTNWAKPAAEARAKKAAAKAATEAKAKAATEAKAKAATADRRKAVSEYKARGSSMPTPSRRSSFGRGASRSPMAAMNPRMLEAIRARQAGGAPPPGGTPGGPSTTRRGAVDMNRSSARGTGTPRATRAGVGAPSFRTQSPGTPLSPIVPTPAPRTGLPDGFKPNMPIVGPPTPPPSSTGTNPSAASNSRFPSAPRFDGRNVNQDGRYRGPVRMQEGGDVGMHRMPDGKMMKDSAHKKHGGEVKKLSRGGGIAKRGTGKTRMC